jgi:hypothetical protein
VKQGDHDAAAGGAHRMAQADAGTVDVGDLPVEPEVPFAADVLGGEGLVDLHQFEIA